MGGNQDKLEGWGSIEAFLGVTAKTIKRRGYPVHAYKTGVVFAYKSELRAHETPSIPEDSLTFPNIPEDSRSHAS